LPAAVDSVLATALAKDPAGRYPSCGRFAEELGAALGLRPGEPADPPRSPAPLRNGSVNGPANGPASGPVSRAMPVSAGRRILRVKPPRPPGTQDGPAAAKDMHAVATDRPAGAGSPEPAAVDDPAPVDDPIPVDDPAPVDDPGRTDPERPARR